MVYALPYGSNYGHKKFYSTGLAPVGLCHKTFTAVINCVTQKGCVFVKAIKSDSTKTKALAYHTTEFIKAVKSFVVQATWGQCCKTFYARDLRIFLLSQSVCQTGLEKLTNEKPYSLFRKSIFYGQKKVL